MNCVKTIAGSGLVLMLTFTVSVACGQSPANNMAASSASSTYYTD
jgi:hypothetical protein